MTPIEKLLVKLIKIPSLSGTEEHIGEFIISQLRDFRIKKQFVEKNRFNVIAVKGDSKKWLVAHMDTVPGIIPARITDTHIFGRGACDNKQSIAAMIQLGNELEDINLLFTVGEEDNFIGAKKAKEDKIGGDLVIIQEPTNFKIITGQYGVITVILKTKGKQQHSSLKNPDSAIHKIIPILKELERHNWTAFNIGLIAGGMAENVVADQAQAVIVIRPKDIREHHSVLRRLKRIRDAEVFIKNNVEPSISHLGFPEKILRGFSEMAFFKNSIQFGAGSNKMSHTDHECIRRKDLNLLPYKLVSLLKKRLQ